MAKISEYTYKGFMDGTELFVLVAEGGTFNSDPDTIVGPHQRTYNHDSFIDLIDATVVGEYQAQAKIDGHNSTWAHSEFLTFSNIPRTLLTDVIVVSDMTARDNLTVSDGTSEGIWEGDVVIVNDATAYSVWVHDGTQYFQMGYNLDILAHELMYDHDSIVDKITAIDATAIHVALAGADLRYAFVKPLNTLDATAIITTFESGLSTMSVSGGGWPGTAIGEVFTTRPSNTAGGQRFIDSTGNTFFRSWVDTAWTAWIELGMPFDQDLNTFNSPTFAGMGNLSKSVNSINTVMIAGAGNTTMTGDDNTFIGLQAGFLNEIGINNTFIGHTAGKANTTGGNNVFISREAGLKNTTGAKNIFLGWQSGHENTNGNDNIYIGVDAAYWNIASIGHNICIGYQSGLGSTGTTTHNYNTFVGYFSGRETRTGGYNTALGYHAGRFITTGSKNISIGYNSAPSAIDATNQCIIGGTGVDIVKVGFGGNNNPQYTIDATGDLNITGTFRVNGAPFASRTVNDYVATAAQTTFAMTSPTADISKVDVWVNGFKLVRTEEYTISGNNIVISFPALALNDNVEIIVWG